MKMPLERVAFLKPGDGPDRQNNLALLRFAFPLSPAPLHHVGNALSRRRTHVTSTTPGRTAAAGRCSATCGSSAPPRPRALQSCDRGIETSTLTFELSEYVLNIHASPLLSEINSHS